MGSRHFQHGFQALSTWVPGTFNVGSRRFQDGFHGFKLQPPASPTAVRSVMAPSGVAPPGVAIPPRLLPDAVFDTQVQGRVVPAFRV